MVAPRPPKSPATPNQENAATAMEVEESSSAAAAAAAAAAEFSGGRRSSSRKAALAAKEKVMCCFSLRAVQEERMSPGYDYYQSFWIAQE